MWCGRCNVAVVVVAVVVVAVVVMYCSVWGSVAQCNAMFLFADSSAMKLQFSVIDWGAV